MTAPAKIAVSGVSTPPVSGLGSYMCAVAIASHGYAHVDTSFVRSWAPSHAIGFWLRRQLDASLPACWHALRELLARYDGEWLAAQEARYPIGWAKLAALPDPLAAPGTQP